MANQNSLIRSLIDSHDSTNAPYTEEEKRLLRQYTGDGGDGKGLTEEDIKHGGVLNEFYTPEVICRKMYKLAVHYGYSKGNVLEPSCATGNMIRALYESGDYGHIDCFETNHYSAAICKALYPKASVHEMYFEQAFLSPPRYTTVAKKTWLTGFPYDLVIGNPPYGAYHNRYATYFKSDHIGQTEHLFIYRGLRLLRPGGLLVFIIPMNFLSTGSAYQRVKGQIGAIADIVDAYRLPPVFESTKICTDIIVLRKK